MGRANALRIDAWPAVMLNVKLTLSLIKKRLVLNPSVEVCGPLLGFRFSRTSRAFQPPQHGFSRPAHPQLC